MPVAKAVFILVGSETTEHFDNSNPRWESYGSTSRLCFEQIKVCHSEVVRFLGGGSLECPHEPAVQHRPVLRCAEDLVNNGRSGKSQGWQLEDGHERVSDLQDVWTAERRATAASAWWIFLFACGMESLRTGREHPWSSRQELNKKKKTVMWAARVFFPHRLAQFLPARSKHFLPVDATIRKCSKVEVFSMYSTFAKMEY